MDNEPELRLKKCRFCGEKINLFVYGDSGSYWAKCNACQATGPTKSTLREAFVAWNARPKKVKVARTSSIKIVFCDNVLKEQIAKMSEACAAYVENRGITVAQTVKYKGETHE